MCSRMVYTCVHLTLCQVTFIEKFIYSIISLFLILRRRSNTDIYSSVKYNKMNGIP
jgi:hypothetical protein